MPLTMSRLDRIYRTYAVTATDHNGLAVAPAAVDAALVPSDTGSPGAGTTWTAAVSLGDGDWRVLLAAPQADQTNAISVPAQGGTVWLRITDSPEVLVALVDEITVL